MVKAAGDIAFIFSGAGVVTFMALYVVSVKGWWRDVLGKVIGSVLMSSSVILVVAIVRALGVPLPGLHWWRVWLYGTFGAAVWAAVITFVWAQFFAPRIKRRRNGALSQDDPAVAGKPGPDGDRYVARDRG